MFAVNKYAETKGFDEGPGAGKHRRDPMYIVRPWSRFRTVICVCVCVCVNKRERGGLREREKEAAAELCRH